MRLRRGWAGMTLRSLAVLAAAPPMAALMAPSAMAQGSTTHGFYEGKTISIVVGLAAGGGYDVYARFFARHLGRHLAGAPRVIVENKPGAATATAATYVYRNATKDGTVLAMTLDMLPLYQTLFPEKVNFDLSKVHWIGNMATINSVIAVSDRSPVKAVADMTKATAILGSNGVLSQTYIVPALLNAFHGAKFKIVLGFQGTSQMDLAIERDEIHGRGGQWNSFTVGKPEWVASGKIIPLIQIGVDDDPSFKGAPMLTSLATDERQRAVYRIISTMPRVARAYWVAPEVPAERVAQLRAAFTATMKDPELLADAAKASLELSPTAPEQVQEAIAELAATRKDYLQVLRDLMKDQ